MKYRVDEIDAAKGIGIILVILGHICPETSFLRFFIYSFHMPLFFILSGIMGGRISNSGIVKKNSKLISCYLLYSAVFFLFDIFYGIIIKGLPIGIIKWNIIKTITLFGMSVLWFITALIIAKSLGAAILKHVSNKTNIIILSVLIFIIISFLGESIPIPDSDIVKIFYYILIAFLRGVLGCSLWLFGYSIKDLILSGKDKLNVISLVSIFIISSGILVGIAYSFYLKGEIIDLHYLKNPYSILLYVTSMVGTIAVLVLSRLIVLSRIGKILKYMGRNSLLIMVTHEYLGIIALSHFLLSFLNLYRINIYLGCVTDLFFVCVIELFICRFIGPIDSSVVKGIQNKLLDITQIINKEE